MCAQLGVVRQGYYRWLADGPCERERTDAELTEQIREIHTQLHGHPGVRRVWAELVVRGVRVARKRVWRLMRAAGLRGRHPRAWTKTTIAGQRPVDAPDLIGQDFAADAPNTYWCGDITYVRTVEEDQARPWGRGPARPLASILSLWSGRGRGSGCPSPVGGSDCPDERSVHGPNLAGCSGM